MPVFVVVATKFKSLTSPILEFSMNGEKMQRMKDTQELIDAIGSVQAAALICNGISRRNIADLSEISLDLCRPGEEKSRYTVHILEQLPSKSLGKYAAFIIPQGREIEWLFSTVEGRKKLLESAGFQRLSVVTLHPDQEYASLDAVKRELTDSIKTFAPPDSTDQIPILSLGSDVGKRVTLVTGFSQISGDFRIEEVEGNDGNLYRRLIFLNNQFLVQSEALIKIIKPKGKKERKKIAAGHLACHYHRYMAIGIQMATHNAAKDDQKDVLVVGLGGGGLCTFLHEALMNVRVTAVEIDPIMLEVAEQYFELKQDKRLHVVIDDGLSFIAKCKTEGVIKFNAILFDVDSKDNSLGISCPPSNFLAVAMLENVKDILNARGLFILNLVCRDVKLRDQVVQDLKTVFDAVCCYKVDEDVNEVMFCYSGPKDMLTDDWKKMLGLSARNLSNLLKAKKLINDDICDATDFLNQLKI